MKKFAGIWILLVAWLLMVAGMAITTLKARDTYVKAYAKSIINRNK